MQTTTSGEIINMPILHPIRRKTRLCSILVSVICACLLLVTTAFALLPPLSIDQVAQLAYNAGFRGNGLVTAIAISFAESSFIPHNILVNTGGSRDRGLWQINDKAHPGVSDACAFDPVCNASAACAISKNGTNWQAWSSTYGGIRYNQEYPLAVTAAAKFNVDAGSDTEIWVDGGYSGAQSGTQANPYSTVGAAVLRANGSQPVLIHIKPGTYGEKIGTNKHIHFVTNGSGPVRIGG